MNLILLAVTPALVIMVYIYFKDRYEKEPIGLLTINFLLGASLSVGLTFALSPLVNGFIDGWGQTDVAVMALKAFIGVALVEEFSKYIVVRLFAQRRSAFNEQFDGIVYAVMVSMGFAALENILYVSIHGVETGILRAFTAVPAHASFAILMGYFMGKAKFSNQRFLFNITGLLAATLFHGAYDFFLFLYWIPGIAIGAFVSLIIGLVLSRRAIRHHQNNSRFRTG